MFFNDGKTAVTFQNEFFHDLLVGVERMPHNDIFAYAAALRKIFVDKVAQNCFQLQIRTHARFELAVLSRDLHPAFFRLGNFPAAHEKVQNGFVRHPPLRQEQFVEQPFFERDGNGTIVDAQFIDLVEHVELLITDRRLRQYVFRMQIGAFIRHVAHELFVALRQIDHVVEVPRRNLFRFPDRPTVFPR